MFLKIKSHKLSNCVQLKWFASVLLQEQGVWNYDWKHLQTLDVSANSVQFLENKTNSCVKMGSVHTSEVFYDS